MPDISLNGNLRNALFIAAAAAGLGLFFYSRAYSYIGKGAVELIERATVETPPSRVIPRKMAVAEPMAGYGA